MRDAEFYYLSDAAAALIGVSPATLKVWQRRGVGPCAVDCFGTIRYPRTALREFIKARRDRIARRARAVLFE